MNDVSASKNPNVLAEGVEASSEPVISNEANYD